MEIDFIKSHKDEEWRMINVLNIRKNCYMISNEGRVYSLISNKFMTPILKSTGYYHIGFRMENTNNKKLIFVHRLVAFMFLKNDNPNIKTMVNHIDGNKRNNRVTNLEWTTPQGNCIHAINNGLTKNRGEDNKNSRITEEIVISICKYYKMGLSTSDIVDLIKEEPCLNNLKRKRISSIIYNITKGGQWSHISKKYL